MNSSVLGEWISAPKNLRFGVFFTKFWIRVFLQEDVMVCPGIS